MKTIHEGESLWYTYDKDGYFKIKTQKRTQYVNATFVCEHPKGPYY